MHSSKAISILTFVVTGVACLLQADCVLLAQESEETAYKRLEPKPGDRCVVCGTPLDQDDVVLQVRGRRVPLKEAMVDSFLHHREKYFSELQPRSALFQENLNVPFGVAQGGISLGWFLFGSYVLVALIFAGMSGYVALHKGLAPIPHFFVGLFFSVLGCLYVLTRPNQAEEGRVPPGLVKIPSTHKPLPCSKCGNLNHPTAKQCSACGNTLQPALESEAERALRKE